MPKPKEQEMVREDSPEIRMLHRVFHTWATRFHFDAWNANRLHHLGRNNRVDWVSFAGRAPKLRGADTDLSTATLGIEVKSAPSVFRRLEGHTNVQRSGRVDISSSRGKVKTQLRDMLDRGFPYFMLLNAFDSDLPRSKQRDLLFQLSPGFVAARSSNVLRQREAKGAKLNMNLASLRLAAIYGNFAKPMYYSRTKKQRVNRPEPGAVAQYTHFAKKYKLTNLALGGDAFVASGTLREREQQLTRSTRVGEAMYRMFAVTSRVAQMAEPVRNPDRSMYKTKKSRVVLRLPESAIDAIEKSVSPRSELFTPDMTATEQKEHGVTLSSMVWSLAPVSTMQQIFRTKDSVVRYRAGGNQLVTVKQDTSIWKPTKTAVPGERVVRVRASRRAKAHSRHTGKHTAKSRRR